MGSSFWFHDFCGKLWKRYERAVNLPLSNFFPLLFVEKSANFLRSPKLLVISRVCFACYLIHPLIITFISLSSANAFHIDFYSIIVIAFGFLLTIFIISFAFTLFVVYPLSNIQKVKNWRGYVVLWNDLEVEQFEKWNMLKKYMYRVLTKFGF